MLLNEGRDILYTEGLETLSSNLTFKRVFDRLEQRTGERVTNASVIRRIWENQADFQTDVLVAIAHDESRPETANGVEAIAAAVGQLDFSTPESRVVALREICRIGGSAHSADLAESTNFPLWISVIAMATTTSDPGQEKRMRRALASGYEAVHGFWSETLGALFPVFGLRLREPYTMGQFVRAVTAYSEGCSLNQRTQGGVEWVVRPTGPDGADQEWSLFAVGFEGLVHQFLEPVPDAGPAT
jgi:hypothetical protein